MNQTHPKLRARPQQVRWGSAALALILPLGGCGGSTAGPSPQELPASPVPLSPVGGIAVATDTPLLTVQNAHGFDAGQADYTFSVRTPSGVLPLADFTVPAGSGTTAATVPAPLPRGMLLAWSVTARGARGEATSAEATFRGPSVECLPTDDPYAKSVVDWWLSSCSLSHNIYNDPQEVLGPPDSRGQGPDRFTGFMSLGEGGYVTVDMEGCAVDAPGPDVRVFQRASSEPVTLRAAGSPDGPFVLIGYRKPCGEAIEGTRSGFCDFDLADGEVEQARYFKIEDGELYPCPGDTLSEGADIDALQILGTGP